MTVRKRYEILEALPTQGPMYISVTKNDKQYYSEGFPVRFFKSDGTEWIANFESGWTELTAILELHDSPNLLIIAYGLCYLVDPEDIKPLDVFGVDYSKLFHATNDRIVLQGQNDFTIVEKDGSYWDTVSIAMDGFKDVELTDNMIHGLASFPNVSDEGEWNRFSYDIDTKKLRWFGN